MANHIFLPTLELEKFSFLPEQEAWLKNWLNELELDIERGDIAASTCLQAAISEITLFGRLQTDWIGVMDEFLVKDGKPIAYSEEFGKRLYSFAFWTQTEVHAIHARTFVEILCGQDPAFDYVALIEELIQPSGWIYNPSVSPTNLRTRMKSEYMLLLAMGIQLLAMFNSLEDKAKRFEALISSEVLTGYLSAEHFRLFALNILESVNLRPANLESVLVACEVGEGYCDFDVKSKVDDYMGTAKRVGRDIPVHSAISTLHARAIASVCDDESKTRVFDRVKDFGNHIKNNPLDIQSFRMREIEVPFGTGISPLEIVAAAGIIQNL